MSCWEQQRLCRKLPFTLRKKISEPQANYYDDMNGSVFEDWFENTLIPNLLKKRNAVIVTDNAKYHSRIFKETPTMNMKKDEMIAFMANTILKFRIQFQQSRCYWKRLAKKLLKNSMSLILWLKKLRVSFYDCFLITVY